MIQVILDREPTDPERTSRFCFVPSTIINELKKYARAQYWTHSAHFYRPVQRQR